MIKLEAPGLMKLVGYRMSLNAVFQDLSIDLEMLGQLVNNLACFRCRDDNLPGHNGVRPFGDDGWWHHPG